MTLATLLSGEQPPDVYVVPVAPSADDLAAAEAAGWSLALLGPVSSKAEALAALAEVLAFPSYFGHNLDALADCLRDVATPTLAVLDGWATLVEADPRAARAIHEILRARTADGGFAAVLVDGHAER